MKDKVVWSAVSTTGWALQSRLQWPLRDDDDDDDDVPMATPRSTRGDLPGDSDAAPWTD